MSIKISRSVNRTCVHCGRRIPWWWFSVGDRRGWYHIRCFKEGPPA